MAAPAPPPRESPEDKATNSTLLSLLSPEQHAVVCKLRAGDLLIVQPTYTPPTLEPATGGLEEWDNVDQLMDESADIHGNTDASAEGGEAVAEGEEAVVEGLYQEDIEAGDEDDEAAQAGMTATVADETQAGHDIPSVRDNQEGSDPIDTDNRTSIDGGNETATAGNPNFQIPSVESARRSDNQGDMPNDGVAASAVRTDTDGLVVEVGVAVQHGDEGGSGEEEKHEGGGQYEDEDQYEDEEQYGEEEQYNYEEQYDYEELPQASVYIVTAVYEDMQGKAENIKLMPLEYRSEPMEPTPSYQLYGELVSFDHCHLTADEDRVAIFTNVLPFAIESSDVSLGEIVENCILHLEPAASTIRNLLHNGFCPAECRAGRLYNTTTLKQMVSSYESPAVLEHEPVCPCCMGLDLMKEEENLRARAANSTVTIEEVVDFMGRFNIVAQQHGYYTTERLDEREWGFDFGDENDGGQGGEQGHGDGEWEDWPEALDMPGMKLDPTPNHVIEALEKVIYGPAMDEETCKVCEDGEAEEDGLQQGEALAGDAVVGSAGHGDAEDGDGEEGGAVEGSEDEPLVENLGVEDIGHDGVTVQVVMGWGDDGMENEEERELFRLPEWDLGRIEPVWELQPGRW
ncbi:hypothetical protein MBLNU230_g8007t1 [Neophaeotheca triangularis]